MLWPSHPVSYNTSRIKASLQEGVATGISGVLSEVDADREANAIPLDFSMIAYPCAKTTAIGVGGRNRRNALRGTMFSGGCAVDRPQSR